MPARCLSRRTMNQVNPVLPPVVTRFFALLLLTLLSPSRVTFVRGFRPVTPTSTTTTFQQTNRQSCFKTSTTTTELGVSLSSWWRPGGRNHRRQIPMPWDQQPVGVDDHHHWDDLQRSTTATSTCAFPVVKHHDCDVHLVDIPWLKPHEQVVSEKHVEDLMQATLGWGAYVLPLLVDRTTGAILDGHHRYHVGKRLGLDRVPAVLVDYMGDAEITVDVWDGCGLTSLTKHQVLAMAKSPHVFPPKTSKHTFTDSLPPISISLKTLKGKP